LVSRLQHLCRFPESIHVMMASFMSYFGGRRDPKQAARDAIVGLRQQLQMIEKKEEYLQKKIEDELKKAKANAVTNKTGEFHDKLCHQRVSDMIDSRDCSSPPQEGE